MKGRIFDIKKFAIHDGPGIRTTVFFKGCPLKCWWCHNPESICPKPELVLFENKCIHCNECFQACPQEAHEKLPDGSRVFHRELCTLCGECVEVCHAEALVMEGRDVTVEEVMAELRKDIPFYENSGGGITLSGGEPTLQWEFVLALLKQCKAEGLHTAMDTCGHAQWGTFEKLLPHVDLVLYDLKQMDHVEHKIHTGASNKLIRENLKKIDACGIPIEIRIPIIPGINDDKENILCSTQFLTEIKNITRVELLPYHNLGESKYVRLGMEYQLNELPPPDKEQMDEIAAWMRSSGLAVHAGE
ncbi:MAG: glycyl-radical enzyme activating protein [Roseibacillus sp.]|nr:glycyl-radical enzyme activating protein [Lentisphaeria bacterium]MDP7655614.1 glycyl-radical enzyme activating protein [Roseibacillus sp.]